MARILATVFITRRGSFGVCECGFNTQVYAYYENAYDEGKTNLALQGGEEVRTNSKPLSLTI